MFNFLLAVYLTMLYGTTSASSTNVSSITRAVGEDMVFTFNTSTYIQEVLWGLRNGETNNLKLPLMSVKLSSGVKLNPNSQHYAGRVSFVGNLTKGEAWFKITNLHMNDTNEYMAKIRVKDATNYENIPVKLIVRKSTTTSTPSIASGFRPTSLATQHTAVITTNPPILKNLTTTLKVDSRFSEDMANKTSQSFKDFSSEFEAEIKAAYTGETGNNFKSVEVTSLSKGSILVTFIVFFKSEIRYDEACAPLENAIKNDKLGQFQIVPGSLGCSKRDSSMPRTPGPTSGVHPGIIAGVVVVGILAIAGLVIAILFVCRKKSSHRDYRGSTSGQEFAMKRRAGEPEEQYACVQRSGASGAAVGNKDNPPLPQYAAIDKSKKTKKKTRGPNELVYADVDHEHNKNIGARPPPYRSPTKDSDTEYADIQFSQGRQHPQQRQPPPRYGNLGAVDYA